MHAFPLLLGACLCACGLVASAHAESAKPPTITGSILAGYSSDYIIRGFDAGSPLTELGLTLNTKLTEDLTLSGILWYENVEHSPFARWSGVNQDAPYDEYDFTLQATRKFGGINATLGTTWFHFENNEADGPAGTVTFIRDIREILFGLSGTLPGGINAKITYYWDIENDTNGFCEQVISKSFPLTEHCSLEPTLKSACYFEQGGFAYCTPILTLHYKLAPNVTLSPYLAYQIELDTLDAVTLNPTNVFYGGIKLTVTF